MNPVVWQVTNQEFDAGPDQTIVVYSAPDFSTEIDPAAIFREVAADAATRAQGGLRIVSMTSMALRHGGTFVNTGAGYQTKVAVIVVYERAARSG
jgi:hypothetical protein